MVERPCRPVWVQGCGVLEALRELLQRAVPVRDWGAMTWSPPSSLDSSPGPSSSASPWPSSDPGGSCVGAPLTQRSPWSPGEPTERRPWPSTGASGWSRLLRALSRRQRALLPTPRTRRASLSLSPLLATTLTLLSSCCSDPTPVVLPPDPTARPTLPFRITPRASTEDLRAWSQARRVDLLVAEILRERQWADALERDGEWERE